MSVVAPIATAMATCRPWGPGATDALLEQLGPWSDSRFNRLHGHGVGDGPTDAVFGERIERLHIEPRVFVTGAIEHVDAKRKSLPVKPHEPSTMRSLAQMRCHDVMIDPASVNWPIST